MSKKRMSDKESWLHHETKDSGEKVMIPANRAARRAMMKIRGGNMPPPIKSPKVNT